MNRRKFINKAATIGTSFAAGYAAHAFFSEKGLSTILGEEWRNDRKVNPIDLQNLPSDEEVLSKAIANIDTIRKSSVVLKLVTKNGEPISHQKLKLVQTNHLMDWGYAFGPTNAGLADPKTKKRATHIADLFNCVTAKCYWNERWHQPIEKHQGIRIYDLFKQEVEWGIQNGMRVKGHPLVWTVEKAIPKWVFNYPYDQQLDFLKSHVQSLMEAVGEQVSRWDLCNEMLWEPAFKNIALREWPHIDPIEDIADYIAMALNWAKEINPNALYSLNDYGLVHTFVKQISALEQRNRYLQLIDALRKRNALPDAVGCQAHIGGKFSLGAFQKCIDHLAESQLPVQITEFWSKDKDFPASLSPKQREEEMAKYIGNIYTLAFAHPNINHFTFWGNEQLFTKEGNPRKPYEVLHQLIKDQWTTNIQLETDQEGFVRFSGFRGTYSLQIADQETSIDIHNDTDQSIQFEN
ncbi:MAG: endo-1,4-beta-xylanase [Bacteroidota bacterium]